MKFVLVDRILELESGRRAVAEKALSLAEEYLADHFPTFPVLPGVLMLEALVQTGAWVVREQLDFRPSIVVLKQARNVTYKSFVSPGRILRLEVDCGEMSATESRFTGRGLLDGREIVKAKFTLRHLTLAAQDPAWAPTDDHLRTQMRTLFGLLWKGSPVPQAAGLPMDG